MAILDVTDYLRIFTARRDCCRELLELSRRQKPLIDTDDYQCLLDVLGRKQRILGCLDEIHRQHPELKQHWRSRKHEIDSEMRDDCDHLLAETEAFLAELLIEEKESADYLTQRRDRTQRQLQAIADGSRVHDAYRTNLAPATHRHLDLDQ